MRRLVLITLFACVATLGSVLAQQSQVPADRAVEVLVPEVLSLWSETTEIAFDLAQVDFPPREFPRRYLATSLPDGILLVEVLATATGAWEVHLQIEDLVDPSRQARIPSEQILFRVDDGPWLRADGSPQVILTGTQPTMGWRPVEIAFALEVKGNERAGVYEVTSLLSGLTSD